MAQSLGEKLQLLFSATMHDIVNKALQRDPIMVLNEYLRQHEEAFDESESNLISTRGQLKTAEREVQVYKNLVAKLTTEIEAIYTDNDPTNDYLAENLGTDLVGKEELLANANRTYEAIQRAYSAIVTVRSKLQGRIISLQNQIALLKAIQMEADIKGMSADMLIKSARMISSGITSVEGLTESIKQNLDKADAKFDLALKRLEGSGAESNMQSRAHDRLAQIRARLGVETDQVTVEAPSSLDMSPEELKALTVRQ
jgi:phage shock protein A